MSMPNPIPPRSVVTLVATDADTPEWTEEVGRTFRIGYYSRADGLDCIWLVNEAGEYEQTIDHEALGEHFVVDVLSDETDLHGDDRPVLEPLDAPAGASATRRVPAGVT